MATPETSSEEMVFETIQQLDYPVLREVANLIGAPENITGTKCGLLKVILRELSSVELEGTEVFKKIESLIKSHYKIPKDNQFLNALDKGMELKKNSFENSFEHFREETKSPLTPTNDEKLHTFIKFKEYKINGKIGTPGQKDMLTFSSLIFQINNGLKKGYSEHETCDAVIKSIAPDLARRTYLQGQDHLNLKTLNRIHRSHFKEPNATSLFTELSNSKQLPSESAQEFVARLMSLRQKILFISKEDNCGYSEALVQDHFLHAILVGLRNDNIRNELRPLMKNSIVSDEDILENLMLVTSDEQEHFQNLNKKGVNINSIEPCDPITSATPPTPKSENPIIVEIRSLKATLDSISSWKDTFQKLQ